MSGVKVKHGSGKIVFPTGSSTEHITEEYDGEWQDDLMHGFGTYKYTSGAHYSGQWFKGK